MKPLSAIAVLAALALASNASGALYEPANGPRVECIYVKGQPIAFVSTDSVNIWMTLDMELVNERSYFRVWCLYQNASNSTQLLEPLASFTMRSYATNDSSLAFMRPESPAIMLKSVSQAQASQRIVQGIFGALSVVAAGWSARPTTVQGTGTLSGSGFVVNDASEKATAMGQRRADTVAQNMDATWRAYEAVKTSTNDGILRKNTVFSGGAITGYMYFPRREDFAKGIDPWAPDHDREAPAWQQVRRALGKPEKYFHEMIIRVPGDSVLVVFRPVKDE